VSDAETTARLRDRIAAGRMRAQALLEAERWDEVAELARSLAKMERELALRGTPRPPTNVVGRARARG
jgi:HAMP domain-containing protein